MYMYIDIAKKMNFTCKSEKHARYMYDARMYDTCEYTVEKNRIPQRRNPIDYYGLFFVKKASYRLLWPPSFHREKVRNVSCEYDRLKWLKLNFASCVIPDTNIFCEIILT